MKIVLAGATGFIGSRLRSSLFEAGHELLCMGRRADPDHPCHAWIAADFAAPQPQQWAQRLAGADCLINTVGIFREHAGDTFDAVHGAGPRALFDACVEGGVGRVIHFSAVGAEANATSAYHRSKHALDEYLLGLPLLAFVVQPSLVFGLDGVSSQRLLTLASMPLVPLPAGGRQWVQPVHVDDLVTAVHALLLVPAPPLPLRRVPFVGPQAITLREYLFGLRRGLQLGGGKTLSVPAPLVRVAARIGDAQPCALLDRAAWSMLQQGSVAPAQPITALLMRPPRPPSRFIATDQALLARRDAQLRWLLPLLRLSLALVWLISGAVSFGLYPVADSLALLARAGVPTAWQSTVLMAAAACDVVLGVLTVWPWRRTRWLWATQALLIGVYSAIITARLPEFWLHPFGPLSKNLPLLALLLLLWTLTPAARPPRR
jgi:uncharacterized protein YbjT (DUF2867 family)